MDTLGAILAGLEGTALLEYVLSHSSSFGRLLAIKLVYLLFAVADPGMDRFDLWPD
jgi:hypothetical protein